MLDKAPEARLYQLIDDNPTCMMVTTDERGALRGRPMRAIRDHASGELWFYTRLSSGKSEEVESDGEVCLCFGCPKTGDYVSVSGTAHLDSSAPVVRRHWNTFVDAWFPEGPEGGDAGVIRVTPRFGQYWDGESSSVLAALKMMLASAKDETPDLGESRSVQL